MTALCLTGKPGAGCTTIGHYLEDIGVHELDPRATAVSDEARQYRPHCVWVDDVTAEFNVDGLLDQVTGLEQALVVRVDVEERVRRQRLISREVSRRHSADSMATLRQDELEDIYDDIERWEWDYPPHDAHVMIDNGSSVSSTAQIVRLDELTSIVGPFCDCPEAPSESEE